MMAYDSSDLVTITDLSTTFTVAAGDFLVLVCNASLEVSLQKLSTWTQYPYPWETELDGSTREMVNYYHPLWKIVAVSDTTEAYEVRAINEDLKGIRFCQNSNLRMYPVRPESELDGRRFAAIEFRESTSAI